MSKITVAVLFGGVSAEHEISKLSAINVISGLDKEKYNVIPVYITKKGRWLLFDGPYDAIARDIPENLYAEAVLSPASGGNILRIVSGKAKSIAVDIVFPALHGKNGEDGSVQGLCELARAPYVGCGVLASSLSMDKAMTKLVVDSIGVRQARHLFFDRAGAGDFAALFKAVKSKIGFPCFVKPANTGSSIGISKAVDKESLAEAVKLAFSHDRRILIEKAIVGREFECAVLGNDEPVASDVGEIIVPGGFYDYDAKYINDSAETVVAPELPPEIREEIRSQTVRIFKAVDGLGLARVDFFLENGTNRVIFNEINTIPGFTSISMFSKMWGASGLSWPALCDRLIELGLERYSL